MCRVHVVNPSYENIYMKNWFLKDSCIRIYCELLEKEIALLHSDTCVSVTPCEHYPPDLNMFIRVDDEDNLVHLKAESYLDSGEISWTHLKEHLEGSSLDEDTWLQVDDKADA